MPYVIAKMRMKDGRATVLLNPRVLAPIFGVKDEEFVVVGIEKLCAPDPETKNGKEQEGRRLIRLEGHLYEVVNGAAYMAIRAKERHADAQARYRDRRKSKSKARPKPLPGEALYERSGEMPHEYDGDSASERMPEPPKASPTPTPVVTPGHRTYVLKGPMQGQGGTLPGGGIGGAGNHPAGPA